jgi:dienelactone hydrolase
LSIVTETGDGPLIARTEKRKQQPQNTAVPPPDGEVFWYLNESETFKGTLFKPGGKGPFPAIVFCQHHPASDAAENLLPRLTEACVSRGYVLLVPGRHPFNAPNNVESSSGAEKRFLQENEFQAANLYSALQVLKARSYVDEKRIAVMGHGAGAISLLFAFPQDLGVRGLLLFSPDRAAWDAFPSVRPRLLRTVENATIPVFVGHRADKDEEPFLSFKEIVEKKGPPNHAKRFKVMGGKPGNGEIVPDAAELRQDRVFLFLEEVMK